MQCSNSTPRYLHKSNKNICQSKDSHTNVPATLHMITKKKNLVQKKTVKAYQLMDGSTNGGITLKAISAIDV